MLVGGLEEAVDDPDLAGDLGAAEDDAERPRGVVADRGQLADLALEQQPGVAGKRPGDPWVVAWARWAAPNASLT